LLVLSTCREAIDSLRQHKQGFAKIAPIWSFPAHNAPEARYRILAFVCEAQGWGAAHSVECLPVIENGKRWEERFVREVPALSAGMDDGSACAWQH